MLIPALYTQRLKNQLRMDEMKDNYKRHPIGAFYKSMFKLALSADGFNDGQQYDCSNHSNEQAVEVEPVHS